LKKRRRIEVLIERRELSIHGVLPFAGEPNLGSVESGAKNREASDNDAERPSICPTCGSTEILRLSEALALIALDPVPPGSSAERSNVHCMFSASEECWVCKPSLHLS
jgi:hypothetical protein